MREVRDAEPDDAPACAAVHVASWQDTYRGAVPDEYLDALAPADRLDAWRDWIGQERPRGCILLAVDDGDVDDTWALLPTLYRPPAAIGRGHGSALMDVGLARLAAHGYQHVELWVHPDNQRARRFYERGGWASDGTTQVEQVWGVELAELRMTKDLA